MKKIVLAIMLVLGFGLTNVSANENTPEGVILAFMEACKNKDIDKALSLMSKKGFFTTHPKTRAKIDRKVETIELQINGLHGYRIPDPSLWEFKVKATSSGYILWKKNPSFTERRDYKETEWFSNYDGIRVVKENGVWKLDNI